MKESWRACAYKVLRVNISQPKFWFKTSLSLLAILKGTVHPKTPSFNHHHVILCGKMFTDSILW